ncbi:hypothetical protein NDI34_08735 [Trichocoleus sp. DQ-U1]
MPYPSAPTTHITLVPSQFGTQNSYPLIGGFMTPTMLRQLWALIETTQANMLLKLDDASLVQWLLKQLKQQRSLNSDETNIMTDYLHSKLSLIRDLAQERQSVWQETH